MNALVYVNIDHGIHKWKNKSCSKWKTKKTTWVFLLNTIQKGTLELWKIITYLCQKLGKKWRKALFKLFKSHFSRVLKNPISGTLMGPKSLLESSPLPNAQNSKITLNIHQTLLGLSGNFFSKPTLPCYTIITI